MTFGKINYAEFTPLTGMPQDVATAWYGGVKDLVGAEYQPLLYLGNQVVKGTNYFFIAEETLITHPPIKRVVKVVINEFQGASEIISVEEIL